MFLTIFFDAIFESIFFSLLMSMIFFNGRLLTLKKLFFRFIEGLRKHLEKMYPLNVEASNKTDVATNNEMINIFFPPHQVNSS